MPQGLIAIFRFVMWFFTCDLFVWLAAVIVLCFLLSVLYNTIGGGNK